MSPGTLLCGIVFFGWKMIEEYSKTGVFWVNLNFIVNGKLDYTNVSGFIVFSLIYVGVQVIVVVTFGLCLRAGVNAGIVSTIWSIGPFISALFDYLFYGQKLMKAHIIGVVLMIISAASISLSSVIMSPDEN